MVVASMVGIAYASGLRSVPAFVLAGTRAARTAMTSTIFHHWLDQFNAWPRRRRRWALGGAMAAAAVVVFVLGAVFGRGVGFANGLQARAQRLAVRNAALESANQGLRQEQQTASAALAALKKTLASHDAELETLKQDQAFYAKLIGIDAGRTGLGVHSIELTPVKHTNAWNFTVTLVNTARNAGAAHGNLTLAVEGVHDGKLTTLDWPLLAGASARGGIPFAFKFFQQLQGSLALPKGFVPNRVAITLHRDRGADITRKLDWGEALAGRHGIAITTP